MTKDPARTERCVGSREDSSFSFLVELLKKEIGHPRQIPTVMMIIIIITERERERWWWQEPSKEINSLLNEWRKSSLLLLLFLREKGKKKKKNLFFFFIYSGILGRSQYNNRNCRWRRDREREEKKGSPTGHDSTGMVKTWNHGAGVSTRKKKKQQLKKSFDFPSFWFFVLPTRQTVSSVSTDQSMNLH